MFSLRISQHLLSLIQAILTVNEPLYFLIILF